MSAKSPGTIKTLRLNDSAKETKKNPSKIAHKILAPKITPKLPEKNKVNKVLDNAKNKPQGVIKNPGRPVKKIITSPVTVKKNSKPTSPAEKDKPVRKGKGIKKVQATPEKNKPLKKASPKVDLPTTIVPQPELKTTPTVEKPAAPPVRIFDGHAQQKTLQDAVKLFEHQAKKTQEQYREILNVTTNMKEEIKQLKLPDVFLPEKTNKDRKDIIHDKKIQKYLKDLIDKPKRRPTRQSSSLTNPLAKVPSPFIYKSNATEVNFRNPAKLAALPDLAPYVPNKVNKNNPLLSEFTLPITDTYLEEIKQLYYHFDIAVLKRDFEVFVYIHDLVQKHYVALLHEAIIFEHFLLFQNSVKHALLSLEKDIKDKKLLYPITGTKYNFKVFTSCIRDNVKTLNNASQQAIKGGDYTEMLSLPQYLAPNEETDLTIIDANAAIHKFKAYFQQCITYLYYLELR